MSGKKILMLVGEFSEEYEIFVFEQAMHAVGHTVHVVCPDKKAGDVIKTSLHDFEGHQTYTEKLGHDSGHSLDDEAKFFCKEVVPAMQAVRKFADELEGWVADDLWPLPTYQEMLFIK